MATPRGLRIVSWNVNGLRAINKRFGGLDALLSHFDADLLCLQETKVTKRGLSPDLALSDGWDSYFAFSASKTGYSGLATFCRASYLIPSVSYDCFESYIKGSSISLEMLDVSWLDVTEIDNEGRCLITVHGDFILFNIYAPALTSETQLADRMDFKIKWFQLLQGCIRDCVEKGQNVVVAGDFNCAPHPIDHCCPESADDYYQRPDRAAFLQMLSDKGPCHDVFRELYPSRENAFSCWNQVTGARTNNYGTRIDLILVANGEDSGFLRSFYDAGVMSEVKGSDHAPVWVERDIQLETLYRREAPLPTSARYLFKGKQSTLDAFLVDRGESSSMKEPQKRLSKRRKLSKQPTLRSFLSPRSPCTKKEVPLAGSTKNEVPQVKGLKGEWKKLFNKKPPLCHGHEEPCVVREVKKSGVTKGKRFYVCARPDGKPPIGRCDHFQWAQ